MHQNIPDKLGNYRIIREIGHGGFATVYLARHLYLKHYAAVKVLTHITETEVFRQEAQTIVGLSHQNIIRVFDFGIEGKIPFLVMEYAPYGTLRQKIPHNVVVPIEAVLPFARQIAAALQYAHQRHIIHRDVKPENMLIGKQKTILLSDFGIALMGQASRTQDVAGTVAYMAPEQIRGKPHPASDQYALAITVYEWLCGQLPFKGTGAEITAQHLTTLPTPPRVYAPDLPPSVEEVILRALEKEPDRRFPTVLSFANALTEAVRGALCKSKDRHFVTEVASSGPMSRRELARVCTNREQASIRESRTEVPSPLPGRPFLHGPQRFPRRKTLLVTSALVAVGILGINVLEKGQGLYIRPATIRATPLSDATHQSTPTPSSTPESTPTPDPTHEPTPEGPIGTLYTTYLGHTNEVFSVSWSPSGTQIVSGGADHTAQVWDVTTGSRLFAYRGHSDIVTSVAWGPSGMPIASGSADQTVQAWDATNGSQLFTCIGHTDKVNSVAWSPDGTRLASASSDTTVRVWDASNGKLIMTYNGHSARVWSVAWSPDGTRLASASGDNTVMVCNSVTGATELVYKGHSQPVFAVAWSPDGTRLASGGYDATAQVWDATTGGLLFTYRGHSDTIYSLSWEPSGTRIASGGYDMTVRIWDAGTGDTLFTYRGHSLFVRDVAWEPSGTRIASASSDLRVEVWQA